MPYPNYPKVDALPSLRNRVEVVDLSPDACIGAGIIGAGIRRQEFDVLGRLLHCSCTCESGGHYDQKSHHHRDAAAQEHDFAYEAGLLRLIFV